MATLSACGNWWRPAPTRTPETMCVVVCVQHQAGNEDALVLAKYFSLFYTCLSSFEFSVAFSIVLRFFCLVPDLIEIVFGDRNDAFSFS